MKRVRVNPSSYLIWGVLAQLLVFTDVFASTPGWDACPFTFYEQVASFNRTTVPRLLQNLIARNWRFNKPAQNQIAELFIQWGIAQDEPSALRIFNQLLANNIANSRHRRGPVNLAEDFAPILRALSPTRALLLSEMRKPFDDPHLESQLAPRRPDSANPFIDPTVWISILDGVQHILEKDTQRRRQPKEWIKHHTSALRTLYGALVEIWLVSDHVYTVPGTQVSVMHQTHADGLRFDITLQKQSPALLITGLDEIKASTHLFTQSGQYQIQGFLQRLIATNQKIKLYDTQFDPSEVFLRLKSGVISLREFKNRYAREINGTWDCFKRFYSEHMPDDFFHARLPKTPVLNPSQLEIPVVIHHHPHLESRELRSRFFTFVYTTLDNRVKHYPNDFFKALFNHKK